MRKEFDKYLAWLTVVKWFIAVVGICAVGTYLAYGSPLSSYVWRDWSGPNAWQRDTLRAAITVLVALFFLWNMEVIAPPNLKPEKQYPYFRLSRFELAIVIGLIIGAIYFTFFIGREAFEKGLQKNYCTHEFDQIIAHRFDQIIKPYFPYLLYVFGFWIGIAAPLFISFFRRVSYDWRSWKGARRELFAKLGGKIWGSEDLTHKHLLELKVFLQNYVIDIRNIAERYLPLIFGLAFLLIYEQLTPAHETTTGAALEFGKVAVWVLMGPLLFIFITMVALGYQSAVKRIELGLRKYIDSIADLSQKTELLNEIMFLRQDLIWSKSPLSFVLSAVKSASILIPLLIAVSVYVLKTIIREESWLHIFFPEVVINLFK